MPENVISEIALPFTEGVLTGFLREDLLPLVGRKLLQFFNPNSTRLKFELHELERQRKYVQWSKEDYRLYPQPDNMIEIADRNMPTRSWIETRENALDWAAQLAQSYRYPVPDIQTQGRIDSIYSMIQAIASLPLAWYSGESRLISFGLGYMLSRALINHFKAKQQYALADTLDSKAIALEKQIYNMRYKP